MRRRVIVKPTTEEQRDLNWICGTLKVRPEDFLRSVISVHAKELKKLLDDGLDFGARAADKTSEETTNELP